CNRNLSAKSPDVRRKMDVSLLVFVLPESSDVIRPLRNTFFYCRKLLFELLARKPVPQELNEHLDRLAAVRFRFDADPEKWLVQLVVRFPSNSGHSQVAAFKQLLKL